MTPTAQADPADPGPAAAEQVALRARPAAGLEPEELAAAAQAVALRVVVPVVLRVVPRGK